MWIRFLNLDENKAGLGNCQILTGGNQCTESADDNVDISGEVLHFVFDPNVIITKIWFNNNHDDDKSLVGDTIIVKGDPYEFTVADKDPASSGSPRYNDYFYKESFAAGSFDIVFYDGTSGTTGQKAEQFYVSAIEFTEGPGGGIPEPATLLLMGMGLAGLGYARRRRLNT